MKRKSSQFDFLTTLQSSRPTADAAFVDALKQKLHAQAQEVLPEPRVSGLALIVQSMNRYSLTYGAVLVLAAFSTILLLPKGLDPADFLAKASEQYETQSGIFHEERLSQRYENEVVVEASLEEVWMDDKGNFLQTIRNPDTKEIVDVRMDKVSNGTSQSYATQAAVDEMGGLSQWDEIYSGNKYVCVQTETIDGTIYKAYLNVSEEDPTVYSVNGESSNTKDEEQSPEQQLLNGDNSASVVKELLETIANGSSNERSAYKEGENFVFEWDADAQDEGGLHERTVYTYFDLNTYQLEKQKLTFGDEPNRYDLTTYLAHEYLPADQAESIFDPALYNLVPSGEISIGSDSIDENGCTFKGEQLNEEEETALMNSLEPAVIEEWNKMFEDMKNYDPLVGEEESVIIPAPQEEVASSNATLPEGMTFIRPTTGDVTQGFHAGHNAYDIADTAKPDILAVADGTVVEVGVIGGWNGGYGNYLIIDHGNGVQTRMANCEEIYVNLGDTVTQGQAVAKMGNTGRAYGTTGIHMHFELMIDGVKVSPAIMNVW